MHCRGVRRQRISRQRAAASEVRKRTSCGRGGPQYASHTFGHVWCDAVHMIASFAAACIIAHGCGQATGMRARFLSSRMAAAAPPLAAVASVHRTAAAKHGAAFSKALQGTRACDVLFFRAKGRVAHSTQPWRPPLLSLRIGHR